MAKYLIQGVYSPDGAKGMLRQGGTSRKQQIEELMRAAGGTLESFYWAFGDIDFFVIADFPDAATAAALGLTVSGAGAVRTKMTVLLTAEEIDQASSKSIDYKVPGASS